MSSSEIRINDNSVTISGSEKWVTHMQRAVISAIAGAPLQGTAAPQKAKSVKKRAGGGGRKKGSRLIGGKIYSAEQIKANPALQKKLAAKGKKKS